MENGFSGECDRKFLAGVKKQRLSLFLFLSLRSVSLWCGASNIQFLLTAQRGPGW